MLAFPAAIRIYVAVQPVDMRKSFNGLWAAAREQLHEDPNRARCLRSSIASGRD
jgi:transposase